MRIISWNCNLTLQRKLAALIALNADVAIVQECERDLEAPEGYTYHWCGVNPRKGLGVLARDVAAYVAPEASDQWAFFLPVALPAFNLRLLAVWAFNPRATKFLPPRTGMALPVINSLSSWLGEGRSVVAGDFNNNAAWDTPRGKNNFSAIHDRLASLGLGSSYHSARGEGIRMESSMTYFFQKNATRGFHIDYCFVHRSLEIESVTLPAFQAWQGMSDHVPLIVTLIDA